MGLIDWKSLSSRITPGRMKAFVFVLLIGVSIAIWIYTQLIFNKVREFQKSVVRTQAEIYISIIDPMQFDDSSASSTLFEVVVKDSPFPRIISDENLNPLPGLWQNVGISPDSTDEDTYRKLRSLIRKMDKTNPPEKFLMPRSDEHQDTLTVYELPPIKRLPVALTDTLGTLLYTRNIDVNEADTLAILTQIGRLRRFAPPMSFVKMDRPPLVFHGILNNRPWPFIVFDGRGNPLYWNDLNIDPADTTMTLVTSFRELVEKSGEIYRVPVSYQVRRYDTWLFHYGDVPFLTWIGWLPVIEFVVLFILLLAGLIGFRNITNAEQRSIWVGMAKETAHQLGTPITSLSGWLELLKTDRDPELIDQSVTEMEVDVTRLTRVASRFSSVGSRPELKPMSVADVLDEVTAYFRARVPRMRMSVIIEGRYNGLRQVMGNHELLNWAFENLIKNSLGSLDSFKGRIWVVGSMSKDFKHVIIDVKDNGRGIPYNLQKKIMKPGFTTRKRGWGLGLSLVKRIIEDNHNGKFILLESAPDEGATFRVILPALGYEDVPLPRNGANV